MNNDTRYNLENIINLLDAIFDDVNLETFCLAHFSEVFDLFAEGMRKDKKINLLLIYCRRHGKLNQLLNLVRDINPYQFRRFEPYFEKARLFISYKRDVKPDEPVALQVYEALRHECDVFIDQSMLVGTPWVEQVEAELRRSDFLITFLSAHSINSEMVNLEIEIAHQLAEEHNGRPSILPVRLAYRDPFPHPLNTYLDPINWAFWRKHAHTPRIIEELKRAISGGILPVNDQLKPRVIRPRQPQQIPEPTPSAQPIELKKPKDLESPQGIMHPQSKFYIERQEDRIALDVIRNQGVTVTIKAPRQMGKSSLLMRLIEAASTASKQVIFLDFQLFTKATRQDPNRFFQQFCVWLTKELNLANRVDEYWKGPSGNLQCCSMYVGDYLLREVGGPVVLAIDEVENMFDSPFRSDFFGMLRSWHNQRKYPTEPVWKKLDLALVTSTEPYQLIKDLNQSPFNVGEIIELSDFTPTQVDDLNRRHGIPFTSTQLRQLVTLLNGHPYLTRKALYLVASNRLSVSDLFAQATADQGPFGDHLRYHLFRLLQGPPELVAGMRRVLQDNICSNEDVFFRLRGAGLVRRPSDDRPPAAYPRCQLYADFFRERLYG